MTYEHLKAYRMRRRLKATEYLGGKCVVCETTNDLEFDHRVASTKSIEISNAIAQGWSWKRLVEELGKCQLLCTLHHVAKTSEQEENGQVPHGGGVAGKRNCWCEKCAPLKREYHKLAMRTHRARKRASNSGVRDLV